MSGEKRFLEIPGYEGLYAISRDAEVKSLRTGKIMKPVAVHKEKGEAHMFTKEGKARRVYAPLAWAKTWGEKLPQKEEKKKINPEVVVNTKKGDKVLEEIERISDVRYRATLDGVYLGEFISVAAAVAARKKRKAKLNG